MSIFTPLPLLPEDPIVHLPILFAADSRPYKINLGVGSYKDSEGKPMPLVSVKKAEMNLPDAKEYLPIEGSAEFIKANGKLVLGNAFNSIPSYGIQAIGGTGALRIGADFLTKLPVAEIYIPIPSWSNHQLVFSKAGLQVKSYRYYEASTCQLDFDGLCQDLEMMPEGSAILLHGCCHNPSGIDPSQDQWKILSDLITKQKLLPFFDLAYQGFIKSLEEDAWAVRYFASQGHEMLIANSFSKNLGLYGERVGGLIAVSKEQANIHQIGSQIKQIIRANYSSPPLHGMLIATAILSTPELYAEWIGELANMRLRLHEMRRTLMSGLESAYPKKDWSFLARQNGFFSFLGLSKQQVERLNKEFAIFMPANGRINVAGLNGHTMDRVIQAIAAVQIP